jgi:hypothetical protein
MEPFSINELSSLTATRIIAVGVGDSGKIAELLKIISAFKTDYVHIV